MVLDVNLDINSGGVLAKVLFYYGLIHDTDSDEQKIVCPFHEDLNPSMKVNLADGSWLCFGCGLTGRALEFVKLTEEKYNNKKLSELNACKKLIKIIKSERTSHISIAARQQKPKDLQQKLVEAEDFYYNLSKTDWSGCSDEHIMEVYDYMYNRGFNSSVLNRIGAKYTFSRNYPIVFPMMDNGKFRGWVSRTNIKAIEAKRKYLYNEGFSRRNTLCGNYSKGSTVYIVEGFMDMLKLMMFGIKNVVAILGWKITTEQINKLKKMGVKRVVSALDNDACGRKGTEYLKNYFDVVRFQYMKDIKDPGDMTKELFNKMNNRTKQLLESGGNNHGRIARKNQVGRQESRHKQK